MHSMFLGTAPLLCFTWSWCRDLTEAIRVELSWSREGHKLGEDPGVPHRE